jgi:hypothetical protein
MRLVSFYCDVDDSNFYRDSSVVLKKQCDDLGIDNLILEENFGNSWIDNVRAKPIFLLKMMNQINEDFFWLDVDCKIHRKIDFEISSDWTLDFALNGNPHDYVHFIKNNESNRDFIIKWINEIEFKKAGSHSAFIGIYKELEFGKIPQGYVSLGISDIDSKKKYFNDGK